MTGAERSTLLEVAYGLVGTPYDYGHDGTEWKDLSRPPNALDCSTYVCRVAAEAGLYRPGLLAPDAAWLLDHLVETPSPSVGDIVGYGRRALPGTNETFRDFVWHVMIYAGTGLVIGACDLAGTVVIRPLEYEAAYGHRQWLVVEEPSFRVLSIIF
jgi:cell wall-associated NlpC family hydrolase